MLEPFTEIVCVDFEFRALNGERPEPICLIAHELRSGKTHRLWRDQFGPEPPYPVDENTLFVAYYASAELGCHLALGWPMPARILDLYVEHRNIINGLPSPFDNSLLGALSAYGPDGIGATEKKEMRDLCLRGGPWTADERTALLNYCTTDVDGLRRLLPAMLPRINLPYALVRGRYMCGFARMEYVGVP